ncbi:MAG TPA: type II toxin-antitoxin system prevent-host-death family antitoxin [Casimicrobiaceae bacterium]|jgi:prevent-host-death family protein|nr:type II toxin-antitoxin system prevent-host-death family antitoxin [Casimicrobiaceae bacterium]
MKTATISQAKNRLSELLAGVKRGETVLILERERPIARIVPVEPSERDDDERLADLERRGIIRRAARPPRRTLPPPIDWPAGDSLLDALLRDRDEARY